jgi:hypothetical protein
MRNWLFGLSGRSLCEHFFYIKENDEHALDFALRLPRHFRSVWVWTFPVLLVLSSPQVCVVTDRVSVAISSEICTKFDAVPLSDPSRNRVRTDTRFQINGRKKINTSIQLREILYTNSQAILVLLSTIASQHYNCWTDGSTSLGNYRYH